MKNVVETVKETGQVLNNMTTTQHEIEQTLTERLKIDTEGGSKLTKNIRPLTLLILLVLQIFIVVASAFGKEASDTIIAQHGILLVTAVGFYFRSKQLERAAQKRAEADAKIAERNAKANVEIEEVKLKAKIKEDRIQARYDRRKK